MSKSAIDEIRELVRGRMELNVPMQTLTTIRTGGPADLVIYPDGVDDLAAAKKFLNGKGIETCTIGSGSSVIVRDGGVRGAVLNLTDAFTAITPSPNLGGEPVLKVEAGVMISDLMAWTIQNNFGNLEFLGGIPGTIGGATANNSGGWGKFISDVLVELDAMDTFGNVVRLSNAEIGFGDRRTHIPTGFTIIAVYLKGELKSGDQVETMAHNFQSRRRSNYPYGDTAVGMIFRNAAKHAPEKLIENCGLKGIRAGQAEVSRLHGNFIVNLGEAEAGNVISLMGMIQERVFVKYKIKLEAAVTVLGSWQKAKVRIRD